jgi:phosphomethylpyrimidine synthase
MCGPQFCSMRITQDLRADVIADGLRSKAAEFRASGQDIYVNAAEEGAVTPPAEAAARRR